MSKYNYSKADFWELFSDGKSICLFVFGAWRYLRKSQYNALNDVYVMSYGQEYKITGDYVKPV